MLESCREDSNQSAMGIVIDQAVEFLQALLDLLTNLHVHLEVCATCVCMCLHSMCVCVRACVCSYVNICVSGCQV